MGEQSATPPHPSPIPNTKRPGITGLMDGYHRTKEPREQGFYKDKGPRTDPEGVRRWGGLYVAYPDLRPCAIFLVPRVQRASEPRAPFGAGFMGHVCHGNHIF